MEGSRGVFVFVNNIKVMSFFSTLLKIFATPMRLTLVFGNAGFIEALYISKQSCFHLML